MRQVPQYLIIGNGRMAKHFCHYLYLSGISYQQWYRTRNSRKTLYAFSKKSTHILLLINDNAIAPFLANYSFLHSSSHQCIHFAARLQLENIYSAHPLMTFTEKLYTLAEYQQIVFILEKNGPDFSILLPGLKNNFYTISSALKNYYHALCVMSGNFTVILWQKFFTELRERFHLPAQIALPYLEKTMQNLITSPASALTGPLARHDTEALNAHLAALEQDDFYKIYQAFCEIFDEKINGKIK